MLRFWRAAEAAIMLRESELSGDLLARKITELIADARQGCDGCRRTRARLAPKNAADLVVETMEKYTQLDDDARPKLISPNVSRPSGIAFI